MINEIVSALDNYDKMNRYRMIWRLQDVDGTEWVEVHEDISMSDYEVLYNHNSYRILEIKLRKVDE